MYECMFVWLMALYKSAAAQEEGVVCVRMQLGVCVCMHACMHAVRHICIRLNKLLKK
jgi:hypothetical protein